MADNLKNHNFFGYDCTIVADSINPMKDRLTTIVVTLPRPLLSELNTHRMFSRNSASSRAIPYRKMLERVEDSPFVPLLWQKEHIGMQGSEYFTDKEDIERLTSGWLKARDCAMEQSKELTGEGCTKQLANRLLEPFLWHTAIITATHWNNFFELRNPNFRIHDVTYHSRKDAIAAHPDFKSVGLLDWFKDFNVSQADIHIQLLAEAIWDSYNESKPKELKGGEWHVPFEDLIDLNKLYEQFPTIDENGKIRDNNSYKKLIRKISVATCARISYGNISPDTANYANDVALYDRLASSRHASPFEHVAVAVGFNYKDFYKGNADKFYTENSDVLYDLDDEGFGWIDNFKGFASERHFIKI